jgi:hypothetical protein
VPWLTAKPRTWLTAKPRRLPEPERDANGRLKWSTPTPNAGESGNYQRGQPSLCVRESALELNMIMFWIVIRKDGASPICGGPTMEKTMDLTALWSALGAGFGGAAGGSREIALGPICGMAIRGPL